VTVVVPLGAALGTTDELAELVGSGPLHPDELARLLLHGPRLRAVTVDDAGVPVAVGSRTVDRLPVIRSRCGPPCSSWPEHRRGRPTRVTPSTTRTLVPRGQIDEDLTPTPSRGPPSPALTRRTSQAATGLGATSRGSSAHAPPAASGPVAVSGPPRATSTTTVPTRPDRPAPATSVRCADGTTGSSSC
jgi:hypothetical protein